MALIFVESNTLDEITRRVCRIYGKSSGNRQFNYADIYYTFELKPVAKTSNLKISLLDGRRRREGHYFDKKYDILRGGGGLGKASCINGATPERVTVPSNDLARYLRSAAGRSARRIGR
ncbi:hypothetical protein PUN28_002854 [Cardiocondyla obscurior]|uniref:Uncharacterized protein n=1 Tax=Cardiocondyla obscurior TaxID=286306 RepID=A0AAW2GWQ1_9HYME